MIFSNLTLTRLVDTLLGMERYLATIDIGNEFKWGDKGVNTAFPSLGKLVSILLSNAYILAGVIFFFLLIGGGLMVIVNAGKDNSEGVGKGKQAITVAVVGFIIIFASYWIIKIISALTGVNILEGGDI